MKINNKGNLLFPMLIAMGVTAFSVTYFYYNAYLFRKLEDQKLVHASNLSAYEASLRALLYSQVAIMSSAQLPANSQFNQCLNDPEFDCSIPNDIPFVLMNENGAAFNDPTSASAGIDSAAIPCNSFPSLTCPFRFELKWSHECVGFGPCVSPDIFIRGKLIVANLQSVKFNINPINYEFLVKIR